MGNYLNSFQCYFVLFRVVEPVAPSISEDSQLLSAGESSIGF